MNKRIHRSATTSLRGGGNPIRFLAFRGWIYESPKKEISYA
jgi:hypothetical protein